MKYLIAERLTASPMGIPSYAVKMIVNLLTGAS